MGCTLPFGYIHAFVIHKFATIRCKLYIICIWRDQCTRPTQTACVWMELEKRDLFNTPAYVPWILQHMSGLWIHISGIHFFLRTYSTKLNPPPPFATISIHRYLTPACVTCQCVQWGISMCPGHWNFKRDRQTLFMNSYVEDTKQSKKKVPVWNFAQSQFLGVLEWVANSYCAKSHTKSTFVWCNFIVDEYFTSITTSRSSSHL